MQLTLNYLILISYRRHDHIINLFFHCASSTPSSSLENTWRLWKLLHMILYMITWVSSMPPCVPNFPDTKCRYGSWDLTLLEVAWSFSLVTMQLQCKRSWCDMNVCLTQNWTWVVWLFRHSWCIILIRSLDHGRPMLGLAPHDIKVIGIISLLLYFILDDLLQLGHDRDFGHMTNTTFPQSSIAMIRPVYVVRLELGQCLLPMMHWQESSWCCEVERHEIAIDVSTRFSLDRTCLCP